MEKCWLALLTTIAIYQLFHSGVVNGRSPLRLQVVLPAAAITTTSTTIV